MGQTVQLLENALRAWEDFRLIDEAALRAGIEDGERQQQELIAPIKHWRELRKHLLMVSSAGFDHARFCVWGNPDGTIGKTTITGKKDLYQEFPLQLASWVASSRRVFNLSEELIMRFASADYSHYRWSDLLWPFDSFAINLEKPIGIRDEDGHVRTMSLILVSSICGICPDYPYAEQDGFEVGLFYTKLDDQEFPSEILNRKEHERLDDDLRHKRWDKVNNRLRRLADPLQYVLTNHGLPAGNIDPVPLRKGDPIIEGSNTAKIIAGLCLYLEALPVGTTDAYHWRQSVPIKAQRELRKIITDGEQICQVNDFNIISPETISLFPETLRAGPAYSVTPHWRRGHFRRAKGQGRNPNAPRTIEVKPTLIHKDQLPEGALPGGAQSSAR